MELVRVGYFSKPHGVKGQLVLKTDIDFFYNEAKVFFVELSGSKAPYFVKEIKHGNNGLIVQLEEVDKADDARGLSGKEVFVEASLVDEEDENDWEGYELIDRNYGSLGLVNAVSDNGVQLLLSFEYKGKEVILPMVEEFIEKIDDENKKIFFNAPGGLIELYLNNS